MVWDSETNGVLARFDENGEFKTDDPAVIEKLKAKGFRVIQKSKKDKPVEPEPEPADPGEIVVKKHKNNRPIKMLDSGAL